MLFDVQFPRSTNLPHRNINMTQTKIILQILVVTAMSSIFVGQACATDVKLYGRISTSLHYTKIDGGDSILKMNNEGSRFGLNIKEEINSDLSIRAYLENGFNSDDGGLSNSGGLKTATLFDRHAVLAVLSEEYGELGFGRMGSVRSAVMPYSLVLLPLDPTNGAYYDIGSIAIMFGADPRANNTISYVSPRKEGFKVGASYSFATVDQEDEHVHNNTRLMALGGNYVKGPLGVYVGASYVWNNDLKDAAEVAHRKQDSQAYTIGATYRMNEKWKLMLPFSIRQIGET